MKWMAQAIPLFVIANIAIAQPIYELLAKNPAFLAAKIGGAGDILLFAAILSFLIPGFFVLLAKSISALSVAAGRWFQLGFIAIFTAVCALIFLKGQMPAIWAILLSGVVGVLFSVLLARFASVRFAINCLTPFIFIIPLVFLTSSNIRQFISPNHQAEIPTLAQSPPYNPIIFLVFDELPATFLMDQNREINRGLFPNFAKLADRSTWYRNTVTVSPSTEESVPAILTGCYPIKGASPDWHSYPRNLFTLLESQYQLNVFQSVTNFIPNLPAGTNGDTPIAVRMLAILKDTAAIYLNVITPPEYTGSIPAVNQTWGDFWGSKGEKEEKRLHRFHEFLNAIARSHRPTLNFAHVLLPHDPMEYLPSGKRYQDAPLSGWGYSREGGGRWINDEWVTIASEHQYLLQMQFVDRLLGELLAKLDQTGMFDSAVILITSDHGIAFWPGESNRKPEKYNRQDIEHALFLLKLPFQHSGQIRDDSVKTIDILPTIMDGLKIKTAWQFQGKSVLNSSETQSMASLQKVDVRAPTFQRRLKVFGSVKSLPSISPLPEDEAIGKNVSEIPIDKGPKVEVRLLDPRQFLAVDLSSPMIPAMVAGYVKTNSSGKMLIAIAVNKIIRAVTYSLLSARREMRFAALVPEDSFVQGDNTIDILVKQDGRSEYLQSNVH